MEPGKPENKALYSSNMNLWKSCDVVNLKTNFRVGESPWNETLNRIRFGEQTKEDIKLLKSRYTKNFNREDWDDAIHAFYSNNEVNDHNDKMLNKIEEPLVTMKADLPKTKTIDSSGTVDDTQFQNKLYLKKGAKVMMVHNVDIADGLVNGVTGKVLNFACKKVNGKLEVLAVIVKFDDDEIGKQCRKEHSNFHPDVKQKNGVPIFRVRFTYKSEKQGTLRKTGRDQWLRQYPLKLAFASTGNYNDNSLLSLKFKKFLNSRRQTEITYNNLFSRSQATRPNFTNIRNSLSWP